ncbi:Pentatricopeptide repeat-containing protein, partial [Thalictrum thalictroides]
MLGRIMGSKLYLRKGSNSNLSSSSSSMGSKLHFRTKTTTSSTNQHPYPYPTTTTPSSSSMDRFVRDRCKSGNLGFNEALDLFDRLFQIRPLPSIYPFNQLLGVLVKIKHYHWVFYLSRLMLLAGIQPDIVNLSTLINSYCCIGKVDLGFAVFGSILKRGLEPDAFTFTHLLKGVSRKGNAMQVMELFNKMLDNDYPVDVVTYGVVVDGFCKTNNTAVALSLMRKMEKTNIRAN